VGEIYVRNNVYANEDVISAIEMFGGEAWMIPITDWILYTSSIANYMEEFPSTIMSWDKADTFVTYHWMRHWEQKLMRAASPFLDDRHEPPFQECMKLATRTWRSIAAVRASCQSAAPSSSPNRAPPWW